MYCSVADAVVTKQLPLTPNTYSNRPGEEPHQQVSPFRLQFSGSGSGWVLIWLAGLAVWLNIHAARGRFCQTVPKCSVGRRKMWWSKKQIVNSIYSICWLGAWACRVSIPSFANNVWSLQWMLDIVCVYILPKLSETLLMKIKWFIKLTIVHNIVSHVFVCKKLHLGRPTTKNRPEIQKKNLKHIVKFCKMSRNGQEV